MWILLLDIGGVILGLALGLVLGLLAKDWVQKSKRGRAAGFAALALIGMFGFTPPLPPETIRIGEPSDEMKVKRGNKPGDPPTQD